jgi:hypothetical protein
MTNSAIVIRTGYTDRNDAVLLARTPVLETQMAGYLIGEEGTQERATQDERAVLPTSRDVGREWMEL